MTRARAAASVVPCGSAAATPAAGEPGAEPRAEPGACQGARERVVVNDDVQVRALERTGGDQAVVECDPGQVRQRARPALLGT